MVFELILYQNGCNVFALMKNHKIYLSPIGTSGGYSIEKDPNAKVETYTISINDSLEHMFKTFAKMRYSFDFVEYGFIYNYNGRRITSLHQLRHEMKITHEIKVDQ